MQRRAHIDRIGRCAASKVKMCCAAAAVARVAPNWRSGTRRRGDAVAGRCQ